LAVPLFEGYGTRIKILEALVLGCNILTTKIGIQGIKYSRNNSSIKVTNNMDQMIKNIFFFLKLKKKNNSKFIYNNYSMEMNAHLLFKKVKKILNERTYN
jgi:hypothetical protein